MAARIRKRDSSGHIEPYFQRRSRYEAVLRALSLWESFARMPRRVQEIFWQRKRPDPVLEFDATVPDSASGRAARRAIEKSFRDATVETKLHRRTARRSRCAISFR